VRRPRRATSASCVARAERPNVSTAGTRRARSYFYYHCIVVYFRLVALFVCTIDS
jgi:hypothetical protein